MHGKDFEDFTWNAFKDFGESQDSNDEDASQHYIFLG